MIHKTKKAKVCDLFIVTMVATVSDRFGLPATDDDDKTPSGFPLSDDPTAEANAQRWANEITDKFLWLAKSKAKIEEEKAPQILLMMRTAIDGDEKAIAELRKIA